MAEEKKIARLIADIAIKTAVKSEGRASHWSRYQPAEPEELVKYTERRKAMTKRKWMATLMLVLLTVGMLGTTVSAAESTPNTGDTPYSFYFEPTSGWRYTEWRNKTNSTSVYINLAQAPANYTRCHVQGGVGTWSDNANVSSVSYETYGSSDAIVVRTGKWRIRQTINEHGKNKARIQFFATSETGVVAGFWSPDCAGSYPAVN